jgi:hypothetical protein
MTGKCIVSVTRLEEDENKDILPSLCSVLREYEKVRWGPTAAVTAKAVILGYLETGGMDGFYAKFRDVFFRLLDLLGVPKKVLVDSMIPKV